MRGRGLKLRRFLAPRFDTRSPPMRGRGLKLYAVDIAHIQLGRPPCGGVD